MRAVLSFVVLLVVTMVILLGIDAVMLASYMAPMFERHIGDLMLDEIRLGPAAIFYLGYPVGVVLLVGWPAYRAGSAFSALWRGGLLGAIAYGTYEFTNYAIMKAWSLEMVLSDVPWGAVLTGFSAWAGVMLTRRILRPRAKPETA